MKKLLLLLLAVPVLAFAWQPTKPVTVIIPVAPGSGNELAFRASSMHLEKAGKVKFVYEHKAGADGNIAMNYFADQPADGHTISIPSCQSTFVASDVWYKDMIKYDPMEFSLVTNMGKSPLVFVANINSTVNTIPELINAVKTPNRTINFATGGAAHQLAFEYFIDKVNGDRSKVQNVPYKGPLPAIIDAAAGVTEFAIVPATVAHSLLSAGKIKIIGVAGEKKLKSFKNTPLMKDYVPGLNVYACWNIVLPRGTNQEIVKWYVDNFTNVLSSNEYTTWAEDNMVSVETVLGPDSVRKDMIALRTQWQPYIKRMPRN